MKSKKSGSVLVVLLVAVLIAGIGYYVYNSVNTKMALSDQSAQALGGAIGLPCLNGQGPLQQGQVYCDAPVNQNPAQTPTSVSDLISTPSNINKISITAPVIGETLEIGKKFTIRWSGSEKGVSKYPIYLIQGGGVDVKTIKKLGEVRSSAKSFVLTVPYLPFAADYRIQLGDKSLARSGMFSIDAPAKPKITIISPNGGEVAQLGKTFHIKWSSTGLKASEKVNISLQSVRSDSSHNLMETPIALNVANSGNYAWKVNDVVWTLFGGWKKNYKPSVQAKDILNNRFKILVRPAEGIFGADYSDEVFTISHI